eukprot:2801697-Rhodomonas_salina.3
MDTSWTQIQRRTSMIRSPYPRISPASIPELSEQQNQVIVLFYGVLFRKTMKTAGQVRAHCATNDKNPHSFFANCSELVVAFVPFANHVLNLHASRQRISLSHHRL